MAARAKPKPAATGSKTPVSRNRAAKVKQADLAAHFGLTSERRVRELFDKGILTCDRNNIDLDRCRLEYLDWLRAKAARWEQEEKAPSDESKDPDVQLAYYRIEQIELAKIKKRKALGELIERSDMVLAVSAAFARAKRVFLKIPKQRAKALAAMDDEVEVREFLDECIREGLDELASTPVETIGREVTEDDIELGPESPEQQK